MNQQHIGALLEGIVPEIKQFIQTTHKPLLDRIEALEKQAPVTSEKGEPGEKGEKGDTGEKGEAGPQGPPGEKGDTGDQGPQGLPGSPGEKGERGEKGDPGLDGKDGAPGPQGERGERGMDGAPGRDGINGKDGSPAEISVAPDDVADQIAKAIALVAESPRITAKSPSPSSVVLNISSQERQQKPVTKTITTRRDEGGNLIAEVIEMPQHA